MRAEQMPAYRSISHTGSVIPLQTPSSSGSSFDRIYVRVCEDRWVIPFPPFCDARSIEDGVLEADVDYVQGDQWRPMFQALRNSNTKFRSISLRVGQTNASVFVTSTHNTQHSRRVAPVQARQCRLERNVKPLEPSQSVHLCCALAVTLTERSCYLKTFVLEGVLLNGQCVENLARGLTHCVSLEHVSFKDSLLGDAGAKNLVRVFRRCCWRLRSICLSGCDLTDASTTCICGLMYSREINLDGQRWQYSLRQCVRENDSVRNEYPETVNHWDLSNNYLTDLFLKKMEHVLGENMTITSLIVSCNCFTAGAIHAFLQRGVSLNRHLSYCDLSRNPGSSAACTEVFSMNDASFSVLSPCPGTLLMYRSLVRPRIQPQTADCAQERKQLKGEKRGETKRNFILNSVQTQNTLYNSDLDSESSSGALPITAQELMQESNPGPSDIYECFDTELNQMNLGALDKKSHNELSVMPLPSRGGKESSDSDTSYTANPDVRVLEKGMARELHTRTSIKRVAKKGKRCTQKKLETRILAKVVQENTRVIQQLHQGLLQISKKHQECDNPSEIDRETCFQLPSSLMLHIQRLSKTAHERAARAPNDSLLFDSSQNASDTMMNEVGRDAPDASNSRPFEPQSEFASQKAVTERCYRGGTQEEVEEMKYIVARQENLIHHLVHAVDMLQKEMNQRNQPRGGSLLQQKQDHQDGSRSNLTCISKYEPSNIFHSNNQQRLEGDVSSGESNEHESPVTPLSIRDSSPSARRDTDEEEHVRAMESHLLQLEYEANVANGLPRLDVPASDSGMIEKIKQRLIRQGWSV